MKKIMIAMWCILIVGSLCGCQRKNNQEEEIQKEKGEYKIYYIDSTESKLVNENYIPKGETPKELIPEYISELKQEARNVTYKKALPDSIVLLEYQLLEKGQLTLDFNEQYSSLTGITEILSRAAIVKTLCQIEGVNYVEFYVDGQPLMSTVDKAVGFMTPADFIDNTGGETNFYQNATITLFFAKEKGKKLQEVRVNVVYDGTIPLEQLVIEQLIAGPQNISGIDTKKVFATVPKATRVIKTTVKDGICYLDLSSEFLEKLPDISNEVAIYSVVNSLSELSSIDKVQFTINGEQVAFYREGMEFNVLFDRNLDIVE